MRAFRVRATAGASTVEPWAHRRIIAPHRSRLQVCPSCASNLESHPAIGRVSVQIGISPANPEPDS